MPYDEIIEDSLSTAGDWYESHRNSKGKVNTNVMTSGIAVAELLRQQFPLKRETLRTDNQSQVRGLSGSLIKRVLSEHGETRKFTSEGGRTSRGTLALAESLAESLADALVAYSLSEEDRKAVADALQQHFVDCIRRDYFDKKAIEVNIDYSKPISGTIEDILAAASARADQPTGVVAQHLVGAKLELRFPDLTIGRDNANAADLQTARQGDFEIGNSAFHVTVAPSARLIERVEENMRDGYRPIVLVDKGKVAFAAGLFDSEGLKDSVEVNSIEVFVGANVEEIGEFSSEGIKAGLANLVRKYNQRIAVCEADQSLKIKEPAWMVDLLDYRYRIARLDE